MEIRVGTDGEVMTMYNEEFLLGFLGRHKIERLTEILFNEDTQDFYIQHCHTKELIAEGFDTYSSAIRYEVDWFERAMQAGKDPRFVFARA